jgi:hypothetical protein
MAMHHAHASTLPLHCIALQHSPYEYSLARVRLAAYSTDKRTFLCVAADMATEMFQFGKGLLADVALAVCRCLRTRFLHT